MRNVAAILLVAILILGLAACSSTARGSQEEGVTAPKYGQLSVSAGKLRAEDGSPVQLKGMSTMGLQWYGGVVNPHAFDALARDWEVDVIRLALYVGEGGYASDPSLKDLVRKGIELAIERGLYVIVDWHVLSPGDPNHPIYAGVDEFFEEISRDYGRYPHLIYEIMNEPNGSLDWTRDLKPYAERLVKLIRKNDPDNIILIGSGTWSQDVDIAAADPLEARNLAYTVHFYTGTHGTALQQKIDRALELGVAVFSTEWGTSAASGTGGPFISEAESWLDFLDARGISWVNWSLANKNETSAAFRASELVFDEKSGLAVIAQEETSLVPEAIHPDAYHYWPIEQLSVSGAFARAKIKGLPTPLYPSPLFVWDFEDGESGGWAIAGDSPVKPETAVFDYGQGQAIAYDYEWSQTPEADNWSSAPRLRLGDTGLAMAGVKSINSRLLLESGKEIEGEFELNFILQYPPSWWTQLPAVKFAYSSGRDLGNGYLAYDLSSSINIPASTSLGHVQLILVGAGTGYQGKVLFDSISLNSTHKGEPQADQEEAELDDPGLFQGLPWNFESGGRQGWAVTDDSPARVNLRNLDRESIALGFSYQWTLPGPLDSWSVAPRISSSWVNLKAGDYQELELEVYVDTIDYQGKIEVQPVIQSPEHGYWFQLSPQEIDASTLVSQTSEYQKHHLRFPLVSNDGGRMSEAASIRNLILITIGIDSDYRGSIAYDNINLR